MEPIQNEGSLDRAARGLFALVFLTLGIAKSKSLVGKLFIGLGIVLGVTAATGTCPASRAAEKNRVSRARSTRPNRTIRAA